MLVRQTKQGSLNPPPTPLKASLKKAHLLRCVFFYSNIKLMLLPFGGEKLNKEIALRC